MWELSSSQFTGVEDRWKEQEWLCTAQFCNAESKLNAFEALCISLASLHKYTKGEKNNIQHSSKDHSWIQVCKCSCDAKIRVLTQSSNLLVILRGSLASAWPEGKAMSLGCG